MPTRYSLDRIERLRSHTGNTRRLAIAGLAIVGVLICAILSPMPERLALFIAAGLVLAIAVREFARPSQIVAAYERTHAHWDRLIDLSDPQTRLMVGFRLRANEVAYYAEMSTRFGERRLAVSAVIPGSHVNPDAVHGARARFGPDGTVVYSVRRGTRRGTMPAGAHRVVPVDSGRLAITSQRVVFAGERETVEISLDGAASYYGIEGTERVRIEYPGRAPGESYSVDPMLFNLAMVRRARDNRFVIPAPPPPLGPDQAIEDLGSSEGQNSRLIS
jgi:hypothetical protein